MALTRTGLPWALEYRPLPRLPHWPFPQARRSMVGMPDPPNLSTVKYVRSPPGHISVSTYSDSRVIAYLW